MYYVHYVSSDTTHTTYLNDITGGAVRFSRKKFFGPFRDMYQAEEFIQQNSSVDDIIELWELGG